MFKTKDTDIIRHDDLVEEGAISDYIQLEFEELVKYLPTVQIAINKFADQSSQKLKEFSSSLNLGKLDVNGLKKLNDQIKQSNDLALLNEKLRKAEAQSNAALNIQKQEEIKLNTQVINQIKAETSAEAVLEKKKQEEIKINAEIEKQKQQQIKTEITAEQLRKAKAQSDKAELDLSKKKEASVKREKDAYGSNGIMIKIICKPFGYIRLR